MPTARGIATQKLSDRERSDARYIAWRQQCQDLERSWQQANTGVDATEQVRNLARWAVEH